MRCPEREKVEALAAGFLDERDAARIRGHAARCAACGRALERARSREAALLETLGDLAALEEGVSCPEPTLLAAFADGEIADDARASLEAHLAACGLCRDAVLAASTAEPVASPRALDAARRRVKPTAVPQPKRTSGRIPSGSGSGRFAPVRVHARVLRSPRMNLTGIGIAAAAALLVALTIPWSRSDAPSDEDGPVAGATKPSASEATPDAAPAPKQGEPLIARTTRAARPAPAPRPAEAEPEEPVPDDEEAIAMITPPPEPPAEEAGPAEEPATVVRASPETARPASAPGTAEPKRSARDGFVLAAVAGPVEVRRRGESAWQAVREGDVLAAGDGIRGGAGGASKVEVAGRAMLALTQATLLVTGEPGKTLTLSIEKGAVEIAMSPRADVLVKTGFAEATATGARFRVERSGDQIWVRSRAGAVRLAAAGAKVTLASGDESSVRAGEEPWTPRSSSRKKH
jgi:hypothetical protein